MSNWILSSTILILAVLILRRLFREKLSLRWQYALWGLVLLRLLVPFTFGSSPVSMERVTRQVVEYTTLAPVVREPAAVQPLPETAPAQPVSPVEPTAPADSGVKARTELPWWGLVWIGGSLLVAGLFLSTNARFSRKLRSASPIDVEGSPLPVYVAENIETPCLFGVLHPAVYLTPEVSDNPNTLRHALAHELTHYRHGDHIWSNLRCLCLVIHWFNPLVWLAARLSRQDAELACDEGTIRRLGEAERAAYGRTLIAMTCSKKSNPLSAATTMTASAKDVKERIFMIAKRPKNALTALLAVTLGAALLAGCSFLGAELRGIGSVGTQVHMDELFMNREGNVEFTFHMDATIPSARLPVVQVQPGWIGSSNAQRFFSTLLGFEPEEFYNAREEADLSRTELEELLAALHSGAAKQLMLAEQGEEISPEIEAYLDSQIAERIRELEALLPVAPESMEREEADWQFRPVEAESGSAGARQILAEVEKNGTPYLCTVYRWDDENQWGNQLTMRLSPEKLIPPYGTQTLLRGLCRPEQPTQEEIQKAEHTALGALKALAIGDWTITRSEPTTLHVSGEEVQAIYLLAVPAVRGSGCMMAPQYAVENVTEQESIPYATGFAEFYFSSSGVPLRAIVDSPVEPTAVVEEQAETLPVEELLEKAKTAFSRQDGERYTFNTAIDSWGNLYNRDNLYSQVQVTGLSYGLCRRADPDDPERFLYVPALLFTGDYACYDRDTLVKNEDTRLQYDGPVPLLAIDARDGSVILQVRS